MPQVNTVLISTAVSADLSAGIASFTYNSSTGHGGSATVGFNYSRPLGVYNRALTLANIKTAIAALMSTEDYEDDTVTADDVLVDLE